MAATPFHNPKCPRLSTRKSRAFCFLPSRGRSALPIALFFLFIVFSFPLLCRQAPAIGPEEQTETFPKDSSSSARAILQQDSTADADEEEFVIVSYNVENFFDPTDDPHTADEEFLPDAPRRWTPYRFRQKADAIGRAIIACGEQLPPALVGLCEVESDSALHTLIRHSILRQAGYRYIRTTGSDSRGIQNALLYQPERFRLLHSESISIPILRRNTPHPTRDILHACGRLLSGDTLDVFVVHLPSRSGGEIATRPLRLQAAQHLKQMADSIARKRSTPYLILMGDFNDHPDDPSLAHILRALPPPHPILPDGLRIPRRERNRILSRQDTLLPHRLYNTAYPLRKAIPGTYKHKGDWQIIDHILLSGTFFLPGSPLRLPTRCAEISRHPTLLQPDPKYLGLRPYRTYYGFRHQPAGTSDHLPLILRTRQRKAF